MRFLKLERRWPQPGDAGRYVAKQCRLNQNKASTKHSMDTDPPHIISIWLVDPVGGTWVDWPTEANVDEGTFTPESWDAILWQSAALRKHNFPVLSQLSDDNLPFLWCGHDSLQQLETDCHNANTNAQEISHECHVSIDEFYCYINRLLIATRFARTVKDAGVCVT